MQHWWDANGLTDLCEPWSAEYLCRFGCKQSCLAARNSVTSCSQNNHIMLDQFLDNRDMPRIQRGTGVVSPNHSGYTPYAAIDNIIVKGSI
jgi:hypothetical protein